MTAHSGLIWLRRDLRLDDHTALAAAAQRCTTLFYVFVFDKPILKGLPRHDRRIEFILLSLHEIDQTLRKQRADGRAQLIVLHDDARHAIPALAEDLGVDSVWTHRDYEPDALARDAQVAKALAQLGKTFETFKDQVMFEFDELLTTTGTPYSVFTPYRRQWRAKLDAQPATLQDCTAAASRAGPVPKRYAAGLPELKDLGFASTNLLQLQLPPGASGAMRMLDDFLPRLGHYQRQRDFPAQRGPSYLSTHLRFGTVSIRRLVACAQSAMASMDSALEREGAEVWLSELIWRDFYSQVLAHHPQVVKRAFKPAYDRIEWDDDAQLLQAWQAGQTGYPLVDAAMMQINQTGYMHNRLRMVTASFLTKDLGLDWRAGEAYFALHLNDFELASNNGGWQWAASTGCDAQPYFRIFNPITQSEKFDAAGQFIRRYLPVLAKLPARYLHAPWLAPAQVLQQAGVTLGRNYPHPVVGHAQARMRTLERYAVVKEARS